MGSRGGRGRGRFGGGGFRHAKQEPFELFPDIQLPAIDKEKIKQCTELVKLKRKLQRDLEDLPYFIQDTLANEEDSLGMERYSDKVKKRGRTNRVSLENSGFMTLQPGYFPLELVQGTKRRVARKVQWNPKRDLNKLDKWAEREDKLKDEDPKKDKEGDDDDDDEEEPEDLEDDEDYETDDYNQAEDCDDDEDEYNKPVDDDDEPTLD